MSVSPLRHDNDAGLPLALVPWNDEAAVQRELLRAVGHWDFVWDLAHFRGA
jgi:hypothetical protein